MPEDNNFHDEVITIKHKSEEELNNSPLPTLEKLPAKVKYIKPKDTKNGVRASFCFELKGDLEGRRAWGSVPYHKNPNQETDIYKWLSSILGEPLEDNVSFKLGDLIGKDVLVVIEDSEKTDENGVPYQNVTKVVTDTNAPKSTKKSKKKEEVVEKDVDDILEEESVAGEDDDDDGDTGKVESSKDIDEDDLPF